ncbi:hypothetical protein [Tissierella sp.]|uniref:hypothetical protein n=1 Tax=Tissierella sp. TaxID=41274 RepID=UPI00301F1D9E
MKKSNILKTVLIGIVCFTVLFITPNSIAFAGAGGIPAGGGDLANSSLAVGFKKLLEDVGKYLIVIAIPAGTAVVAYCFIRKGAAEEMDHKKWSNRITIAIISTIGSVVAGVIISVFGSYFGA